MSEEFDPEVWQTWPIPDAGVLTRRVDGRPRGLNQYGDGWADGFELALLMAHRFHQTGEWVTP